MLSEYVHEQTQSSDRELREIANSRPRYERPVADGRSRLRAALRGLAFTPAKATRGASGRLAGVVIRPATGADAPAVERLAEASERRTPSGLVLVAEVDDDVVAALPVGERYVLTDLLRSTGDVVQLLELRSEQLRAAHLDNVA